MKWVLVSALSDWFQRTLGKYIFYKTRLRISYRQKLKDIVGEFELCLRETSGAGNLKEMIAEARDLIDKEDKYQKVASKLNSQLDQVSALTKRVNFLKEGIDHSYLSSTPELCREFGDILSDSKQTFFEFMHTLYSNLDKEDWQDISQKLKMNTRGYPMFERIWNDVVNTYMHVSLETHKILPEVSPVGVFESLPKL